MNKKLPTIKSEHNALDLQIAGARKVARDLGIPWTPPFSPPAVEASRTLNLGALVPIGVMEDSPVGKSVQEIIRRAEAACGELWAERVPMTFDEYCDTIQDIKRIKQTIHREKYSDNPVYIENDSDMLRRFVTEIYDKKEHSPDFSGYIRYIIRVNEELGSAILGAMQSLPPSINESDRHEHSLIVGSSGAGKSELLKLLVHHAVKHPELGAVLVLDPGGGKLAREIARWREFAGVGAERLVYLDAMAREDMGGLVPALNPLVRGKATADELMSIATQLADALTYLAGEGEGLTSYMERVATFGLRVLLDKENSTLKDLWDGLVRKDGEPLASLGKRHSAQMVRGHYEHEFFEDHYKSAKRGLSARLGGALSMPVFERILTAPNPFNLQAAVEAGRVIVVNCASAGEKGEIALGRLLMAQVAALGRRRSQNPYLPKAPLHVIVDEATQLMAPPMFNILQLLRKENIWLTMAQQGFGDGVSRDMRSVLKINTKLKMFGRSDSMGDVFRLMDWKGDSPKLERAQWIVSVGGERQILQAAEHLRDNTNAMTDAEWSSVLEAQFAKYYRRVETEGTPPSAERVPSPALPSKPTWKRQR